MKMTILSRVTLGLVMVGMLVAAQPAAAQISAQHTRFQTVRAYQTVTQRIWVSAGWHEVVVDGDGDTDLDLYVYNAWGRLLDLDDDETDYCVTEFYMPRGGYITVRINNLGRVYNNYRLIVR